jgi:NTP pyrophosphatase (non-canonical NTP hydrolase)
MPELTQLPQLGDLAKMEEDVCNWCIAKGWYAPSVTGDQSGFEEHMALLHSEVGEMTDAYRRWGTDDATNTLINHQRPTGNLPKPEGVGSEAADVLIRMLDDSRRHNLGLAVRFAAEHGRFGLGDSFIASMNTLHTLIALTAMAHDDSYTGFPECEVRFAKVLVFLLQVCEKFGIDLQAEYERKMRYNWTRAYRHGNKRL